MGTLHLTVNVCSLISGLRSRAGCLLGWSFIILLLWTLTLHDYIIYYQAWGLSGHTSPRGDCACIILEDSGPLEAEEDYLLFSWSDSKRAHLSTTKKFSILNLSSLHPYGKPCLDHTARLWSSLLATAQQLIMVVRPRV